MEPASTSLSQASIYRLLHTIRVIAWEADPLTLGLAYITDSAPELLGYPTEAWLSQQDFFVSHVHADDRAETEATLRAVASGGGDRCCVHRMVTAAGQARWFRTDVHAHRDAAGHVRSLIGVMSDIAGLKAALDVRIVVDTIDSIVWESHLETCVFTMISKQAERILGYPIERWLTEPFFWEDHVHPEDREWVIAHCQKQAGACKGHEFDYRFIAADGRTVWLKDIVSVVVEAGRPVRLRGVMIDITASKLAEQERDRLLVLEREAREKAEDALLHRDEFMAIAAHEMRTPVMPLLLQLESLKHRLAIQPENTAGSGRSLDVAIRCARRLAALVNRLLDVSRLATRKLALQPEEIDLCKIVRVAMDELQDAISESGCPIIVQADTPVIGEWDRIGSESCRS